MVAGGRLERVLVALATLAALVAAGGPSSEPAPRNLVSGALVSGALVSRNLVSRNLVSGDLVSGDLVSGTPAGPGGTSSLVMAPAAVRRFADDFNPFDSANPLTAAGITSFIYEPLLEYDGAQMDQYYPWLATSWTFSTSGQTVTFAMRPGVHWRDGSPLQAADAAYTYNLLKQYPALAHGLPVVSAVANGPLTFSLTLSRPAYTYLDQIASVPIVKVGYGGGDVQRFVDRAPDGTGPYQEAPRGFSPTRVLLVARRHYWQKGEPGIGQLVFPAYASPARLRRALLSGMLDWAGTFMPDVQRSYVGRNRPADRYWLVPDSTMALDLNLARVATAKLGVRSAISSAIDRTQVSLDVSGGTEPPATSSSALVLPEDAGLLTPADRADLGPQADLGKAGRAMASAGYHLGAAGLWADATGHAVTLTVVAPAGTALATAGAAVARQLHAASFGVTFRALAPALWQQAMASGDFDVAMVQGPATPDPYFMYKQWLDPALWPRAAPAAGDFGRLGPSTLPSVASTVQRALASYASSAPGSPAALAATRAIARVVSSQKLVVPVIYGVAWGEFSTRHATGWPNAEDPYEPATPSAPFAEYTLLQLAPAG